MEIIELSPFPSKTFVIWSLQRKKSLNCTQQLFCYKRIHTFILEKMYKFICFVSISLFFIFYNLASDCFFFWAVEKWDSFVFFTGDLVDFFSIAGRLAQTAVPLNDQHAPFSHSNRN